MDRWFEVLAIWLAITFTGSAATFLVVNHLVESDRICTGAGSAYAAIDCLLGSLIVGVAVSALLGVIGVVVWVGRHPPHGPPHDPWARRKG